MCVLYSFVFLLIWKRNVKLKRVRRCRATIEPTTSLVGSTSSKSVAGVTRCHQADSNWPQALLSHLLMPPSKYHVSRWLKNRIKIDLHCVIINIMHEFYSQKPTSLEPMQWYKFQKIFPNLFQNHSSFFSTLHPSNVTVIRYRTRSHSHRQSQPKWW